MTRAHERSHRRCLRWTSHPAYFFAVFFFADFLRGVVSRGGVLPGGVRSNRSAASSHDTFNFKPGSVFFFAMSISLSQVPVTGIEPAPRFRATTFQTWRVCQFHHKGQLTVGWLLLGRVLGFLV